MTYFVRYASIMISIAILAAGCSLIQSPQTSAPSASAPLASPASDGSTSSSTHPPPNQSASAGTGDTIMLTAVQGKSEARYRVREQLASVSLPSDAIGRTQAITGQIVGKPDGSIVSADSKFVVDLRTLASDRSARDNFLRQNVLNTSQYPDATFVPTKTEGLPLNIPPASTVSFKLIGNLTIRNVTKQVAWDVTCKPANDQGTCTATTSFKFDYFNLPQPRVPVVLSVEDIIKLEVDVNLQRVNS
jgi:polyisoprenoid-binding protein YceI